MALNDLLQYKSRRKGGEEVSRETIVEHLEDIQLLISYWRVYPDKLVDFYCGLNPDNTFHLFFYQRLFLRAVMRHRYVYATFVRAWSKSFMSVLSLVLKAILYPRAQLFTAAGGKEQSAQILSDKVDELCRLIPALEREIIWDTRGQRATTRQTKDSVKYTFKNGSTIENVAATEKTRGRRFQSGLLEECIGIDQTVLNEVLIPTMNVSRQINSQTDPNETLNKSQTYVNFFGRKSSNMRLYFVRSNCKSLELLENPNVI